MTDEEAKDWLGGRYGGHAVDRISRFLDIVITENARQNLIAPSTIPMIWSRHAADSAQLLTLVSDWSSWVDIGTGGGFPGMIVALLGGAGAVTMIEPRRKRAVFLQNCIDTLSIRHASVVQAKIEAVAIPGDVISARAVSSIATLLQAARPCATKDTTWLLPRGSLSLDDTTVLQSLQSTMFHVEQSRTGADSAIVVLRGRGR